jgi:hypothetical protein
MQYVGVCYFLFILRWQLFCCNGSIICTWRCNAGCVSVVFYTGVISGAFIQRLKIMVFASLGARCWYMFCSHSRGFYIGKFYCIYIEVFIQNAGVRSSSIWRSICRVMGVHGVLLIDVMFCLHRRSDYWTVLYTICCNDDSIISLNFLEFRWCIFPFWRLCLWSWVWM